MSTPDCTPAPPPYTSQEPSPITVQIDTTRHSKNTSWTPQVRTSQPRTRVVSRMQKLITLQIL